MNYPRVNLLKKEERRYQGAVSQRFILMGLVITPIIFITILSGIKLVQYGEIQSNLKSSRSIWANLEPRVERFKIQQRQLKDNRKVIDFIEAWTNSQVSMDGLLLDIQQTIPRQIQLTHISIRSQIETAKFHNTDELKLDYRLILQGISQGNLAEDEVISLRGDLLKKECLSGVFESVKLASMSKRDGENGEKFREFRLEGSGSPERTQK